MSRKSLIGQKTIGRNLDWGHIAKIVMLILKLKLKGVALILLPML